MLYRFKALAKRRDPDQLDVPLALASPRGWVFTLVIGFCMLALIGWGFLGRVPQHVTVTGRLQYPGGLVTMQSDARGTVKKLTELGVTLDQGDALAYLQRGAGEDDARISGVTGGRVIQNLVSVGDVVDAGTPISVVEPGATEGAALEAVVEVPAWQIPSVSRGQDVKLTVSGIPSVQYGVLRGRVESLAPFPAATDGTQVGPTQVVIRLERADTVSGYAWTSHNGPDRRIESQTPVVADISIGEVPPLALLGA